MIKIIIHLYLPLSHYPGMKMFYFETKNTMDSVLTKA